MAGAAGAASTPAFYGRVFNQIFNLKARFITGYPGQNEILHALESGEVEAMASPFWSSLKTSRPAWYKEGKIRFLFQYGGGPHPELKNVPPRSICCRSTPTRRCCRGRWRRSGSDGRSAHRPAFPPIGSRRLRGAMMATFKDPAFLADCAKQRLECADPRSGDELGTLIGRAYGASADVRKRLIGMYQVTK